MRLITSLLISAFMIIAVQSTNANDPLQKASSMKGAETEPILNHGGFDMDPDSVISQIGKEIAEELRGELDKQNSDLDLLEVKLTGKFDEKELVEKTTTYHGETAKHWEGKVEYDFSGQIVFDKGVVLNIPIHTGIVGPEANTYPNNISDALRSRVKSNVKIIIGKDMLEVIKKNGTPNLDITPQLRDMIKALNSISSFKIFENDEERLEFYQNYQL